MLENYRKFENGVIKQINVEPIKYDIKYVDERYNTYGELSNYMSYLRYGYMIGSIGYIPNTILDIGYGNGSFIETCTKTIKNCYGNDISNYKIPNGCKFIKFDDMFDVKFDVITFFDSLEHFENISFVKNLNTKYIIISIPNCHYFSDEWFRDWKHRRENEHIWHFNEKALIQFMKDNQYELINTSNIEDLIRINNNKNYSNILTCTFKKK